MDETENKEAEQNTTTEKKQTSCLKKTCWKKCLVMTLAAFLGSFLAVYFVSDQANKSRQQMAPMLMNNYQNRSYNPTANLDRDMMMMQMQQEQMMRDSDNQQWNMPSLAASPVKINTGVENGNFEVKIDLAPLNNNPNNIIFRFNGRKLTLRGTSTFRDSDYENEFAFYQDLIIPRRANLTKTNINVENNEWIMRIPLE